MVNQLVGALTVEDTTRPARSTIDERVSAPNSGANSGLAKFWPSTHTRTIYAPQPGPILRREHAQSACEPELLAGFSPLAVHPALRNVALPMNTCSRQVRHDFVLRIKPQASRSTTMCTWRQNWSQSLLNQWQRAPTRCSCTSDHASCITIPAHRMP